jgi:hypothetical protein
MMPSMGLLPGPGARVGRSSLAAMTGGAKWGAAGKNQMLPYGNAFNAQL